MSRHTLHRCEIGELDGSIRTIEFSRDFTVEQREIALRDGRGWSATISCGTLRVALREKNRGSIEAQGDHGLPSGRPRTGETSRAKAIQWAIEKLAAERTRRHLAGEIGDETLPVAHATGSRLSIQEIRDLVLAKGLHLHCGKRQQQNYLTAVDTLIAAFGPDKRIISQDDVRRLYLLRSASRPNGTAASPGELQRAGVDFEVVDGRPRIKRFAFPARMHRRPFKHCEPQTVLGNLKDAKTFFGYLMASLDPKNRPYLTNHPFLEGLDLGSATKRSKPVPTVQRFQALVRAAPEAVRSLNDHLARHTRGGMPRQFFAPVLRALLMVAYHSGHRVESILQLRLDDLRLTESRMRDALREASRKTRKDPPHEDWVVHFPDGLMYFREEYDKQGYDRPAPMSPVLRAEVDLFLRLREEAAIDSPYLFWSPNDPKKPLRYGDALNLLNQCEETARKQIAAAGGDPDLVVPDLGDQKWHGFRALWTNLRDDLGWGANKNSAWPSGWSTKIGGVQDVVYRRLKPHYIYAVVCGSSVLEVVAETDAADHARAAIQVQLPFERSAA